MKPLSIAGCLLLFAVVAGYGLVHSEEPATAPPSSEEQPAKQDAKSDKKTDAKDEALVPNEEGKVELTEQEWRKRLTKQQFKVLRQKGTERAFRNEYDEHFEAGAYACAACGQILFESDTKFNSGCGWPAFYAAKAEDRVIRTPDFTHNMQRVEVTCARCGSHLGHVFQDGYGQPTGERFCINSVSLKFLSQKELAEAKAAQAAAKDTQEPDAVAEQPAGETPETPVQPEAPEKPEGTDAPAPGE